MAALFWELVLIRWLGASVRVVAYYANFVLLAAFFGLGAGSLLARFQIPLRRAVFPTLTLCVAIGAVLGGRVDSVRGDASEYVWYGAAYGLQMPAGPKDLPLWQLLGAIYLAVACAFAAFGQWIGNLFKALPPLQAYTVEIAGSIAGIWSFALLSYLQVPPLAWVAVGSALLLLILERHWLDYVIGGVCVAAMIVCALPSSREFIWSPYYKIKFEPITRILDIGGGSPTDFEKPIGYRLTVNNDYHQMMLDLSESHTEHLFFDRWRQLYNAPHRNDAHLPAGPILVVGAGTGNDVMAALRNTRREIYAVDIDPAIVALGRAYHFEKPYQDPRVHVVIDDARSFIERTPIRFAHVVFGFLDSHTLLSSFSSLRLDNFVYTRESIEQVKKILLPGGEVSLTFASNRPWIHERMISLLNGTLDGLTEVWSPPPPPYANGILYENYKAPLPAGVSAKADDSERADVPTDDWPFLYLEAPRIPEHYRGFLAAILVLSVVPLLLLPKGQRRISPAYFFLGAAFFLLETSNVVSLSLLYGSTWIVNVSVFSGVLGLVLLGNWVTARRAHIPLAPVILLLAGNIVAGYLTPPHALLSLGVPGLKTVAAVLIFLGPIFFASMIFAQLIRNEANLYQAYGSNLMGAVVGGASEYLSMVFGFKFLLVIALFFYLTVYLLLTYKNPLKAPAT